VLFHSAVTLLLIDEFFSYFSELRTLAAIIVPCSVKAYGNTLENTLFSNVLPSLLMSPSIAGFPFSAMGWLSFFVAIWSYIVIYKTKGKSK